MSVARDLIAQAAAGRAPWKLACRVVSTANITLSGLQTVDGVALAEDDRVLVAGQTAARLNGPYLAKPGAWIRAPEANSSASMQLGSTFLILEGTEASNVWRLTSPTGGTVRLGVTALVFEAVEQVASAFTVAATIEGGEDPRLGAVRTWFPYNLGEAGTLSLPDVSASAGLGMMLEETGDSTETLTVDGEGADIELDGAAAAGTIERSTARALTAVLSDGEMWRAFSIERSSRVDAWIAICKGRRMEATTMYMGMMCGIGDGGAPPAPTPDEILEAAAAAGFWADFAAAYTDTDPITTLTLRVGDATYGAWAQATAGQRPPRFVAGDGAEGADFDGAGFGSGDYLKSGKSASAFNFLHQAGGASIYLIVEFDSAATLSTYLDTCNNAVGSHGVAITQNTSNGNLQAQVCNGSGTAHVSCVAPAAFAAGTRALVKFVWDDAVGGSLSIDGGTPIEDGPTGSVSASDATGSVTCGALTAGSASFHNGRVYSILAVPGILDLEDDTAIMEALAEKYGVTLA